MDVKVQLEKCTGCHHCFDVCPVAVFVMHPRADVANIVDDPEVAAKFQFREEKSIAELGADCILCNACLTECEGSCITIWDDDGKTYQSTYK
jgi:NAD-dependent dihydropyrimidine dehydrogenase PreA subunit